MLRKRLLAKIAEQPDIYVRELLDKFPRSQHEPVLNLLRKLRRRGLIEMPTPCRYRLAERREPITPKSTERSSFIAPPSLARLMAGR